MAVAERELDDASLVAAAQVGDPEAFAELFRRHYPTVRRVCARRLGSAAEADEIAQAAFVRAYERIQLCGGDRRFGAWVQVIAYRVAMDVKRIQARATPTDLPVAERGPRPQQLRGCRIAGRAGRRRPFDPGRAAASPARGHCRPRP